MTNSRKTSLRGAPVAEDDDQEPQEVVKFGGDGRSQPPRLLTTRIQAEREGREDELEPEMADRSRWLRFEPTRADDPDRGWDYLGRPVRSRPDRYAGQELANPAALGAGVVPRSIAVHHAVVATKAAGRLGSSLEAPAHLSAGHFESSTALTQQEKIAAQTEQVQHQAAVSTSEARSPAGGAEFRVPTKDHNVDGLCDSAEEPDERCPDHGRNSGAGHPRRISFIAGRCLAQGSCSETPRRSRVADIEWSAFDPGAWTLPLLSSFTECE